MQKESLDFLKALVNTASPSGFERPAQDVLRQYMKRYADEVRTDVHGNVIGVRNAQGKLRVMLAGHVDEIGLMVQHITEEGYIYFAAIGGVDPSLYAGQRVSIHNDHGDTPGVIGKKPIHLLEAEERKKEIRLHALWIDIGAKNRKDAEKSVAVGDHITLAAGFQRLKNNLVVARGFDDRTGSFVVAETMRRIAKKKLNIAVYSVSTVQEEIGLRGARTSAFGIDPHVGVAVDVGFASDYPDVDKKRLGEVSLGKGPILCKGPNINPVLGKMLLQVAKKNKIPYQFVGEPRATGTDANVMQITRSGVAAALVSIPNRYMHTPVEVVSLDDLDNVSKLLAALLVQLRPDTDFTP